MPEPEITLDRVVIATRNPGKVAELRTLLAGAGVEVLGIDDVAPDAPEPAEGAERFEANATLKAETYADACGLPCIADDSGLEVDALGGAPGVISSHYAWDGRTDGEPATLTRAQRDDANIRRLLTELEGVEPDRRTARFVCVMALALPPASSAPGAEGFQPSVRAQPEGQASGRAPYDGRFTQRRGGRLPHWDLGGATCFVTFHAASGVSFSEPERRLILDSCLHADGTRYHLHRAVVMPDHVHLLLRTIEQPDGSWPRIADIAHSIKSFTANAINKGRGAAGPIWQREYFDRTPRSARGVEEAAAYIENNPVEAGLVEQPGDYPYLWRAPIGLRPIGGLEALRSSGEEGRPLALTRGAFEGRIGLPPDVPRGEHGFGYDPIFLVAPDFARTSAELTPAEKNARSHRGAAARAMVAEIARLRGA